MSEATFHRQVIEIEVLSKDPIDFQSLQQVAYEVTDGAASGTWSVKEQTTHNRDEIADLLVAQGSDPSFLLGDDE